MAPILDVLADGREHLAEEIQEEVAASFRLTEERTRKAPQEWDPHLQEPNGLGLVHLQDPTRLRDMRPYIKKIDVRSGRKVYRITRTGIAAQRNRVLAES